MDLDELFQYCQDFLLKPDIDHDFPHAIVVAGDGTLEMLALDLGITSECTQLLREVIVENKASCAVVYSEAWGTLLSADKIVNQYGIAALMDFRLLPGDAKRESLLVYAQDASGAERFRRWTIHGTVPDRTYELTQDGIPTGPKTRIPFRPLFEVTST